MSVKQAPPRSEEQERDRNAKKIVMYNRRARFEYEIMESYEAGMVLVGTEVKSLRNGRANLQDAFCRIEQGELWLYNMHITPYELGNRYNVEPLRKRKLLLHASQIREMQAEVEQKGLTVIPLALFFQRGFAKLEIAIGRGKKLHDKRESIAERDQQREARRQLAER